MDQNNQNKQAQKIRDRYVEKQSTEMDDLRELDAEVRHPALAFAYTFGSIGAIIMGAGMSLLMTDIGSVIGVGDTIFYGVVIGVVGMTIALINYPIYKGILSSRKKKYAARILELSEQIMDKK